MGLRGAIPKQRLLAGKACIFTRHSPKPMATKELVLEKPALKDKTDEGLKLILWNDDFNTFDWVIESLMKVCEHTPEQAEQCAWLVHTKGKYAVKHGSKDYLLPRKRALELRGLTATIE